MVRTFLVNAAELGTYDQAKEMLVSQASSSSVKWNPCLLQLVLSLLLSPL